LKKFCEYFLSARHIPRRFNAVRVDCTHYIVLYTQQCVMNDEQIE